VCLLTDDYSPLTPQVAQALLQQGWIVVILTWPQDLISGPSWAIPGAHRVILADITEAHLQTQLTAIAQTHGAIATCIHLNPQFAVGGADGNTDLNTLSFLEIEKVMIKQVFLLAKHLKKSLNHAAQLGNGSFMTVTHLDGAFGLGDRHAFSPVSAGLFGLTKTLNAEWESVFCRALDLSPDLDAETAAHCVLAELHDPNRYLTEVAYGEHGRCFLVAESGA
jgi:NAD(P)-dependent dehydrogenase (short-subunit alcohol dehydrogenase family)